MGVSRHICSANKAEIRILKKKFNRIADWKTDFKVQLTPERRMAFTVSMNELAERMEYLRRDKHANLRRELAEGEEPDYSFHYVLKKKNVKNRKI